MQGVARKPTRSSIRLRQNLLILLAATFILLCSAMGRAGAQSAEEELYLDPITVTATRTPERVSDVADSVEVFDLERIESLQPGDLIDFLTEGAGVILPQASGRGGQSSLFLRGSESNFTSVMIDGFKLTFPDGSAYDFGHLSPEWVGAAEILKGPQSPLYGSDAASGVMNFIPDTGKPGEAPSFTVPREGRQLRDVRGDIQAEGRNGEERIHGKPEPSRHGGTPAERWLLPHRRHGCAGSFLVR